MNKVCIGVLFMMGASLTNAAPKPTIVSCMLQNRPEMALDVKAQRYVQVGPDRWFVICHNEVFNEKKIVGKPWYLKGDLGGYGYYAKFEDATKAAYDETHPKKELNNEK
jgi:hypothetical protein